MKKNKSSIIWFYALIAAFSAVVIFGMKYLGQLSKERQQEQYYGFTHADFEQRRLAELTKFAAFGIKEDLMVTLQDGKEVNLKEALKGKVTVLAQFFSDCPQCENINFEVVKKVLDNFKEEDLQVITVNVNADAKDIEQMRDYSVKWGEGSPRWWFANTNVEAFNGWAQKNLGFAEFERTTGPEAEVMPVKHDMGIVVIDRTLTMVNKEDVFSAKVQREGESEEQTLAYAQTIQQQLMSSIRVALTGEDVKVKEKSYTHIYLAIAAGLFVALISAYFVSKKMKGVN